MNFKEYIKKIDIDNNAITLSCVPFIMTFRRIFKGMNPYVQDVIGRVLSYYNIYNFELDSIYDIEDSDTGIYVYIIDPEINVESDKFKQDLIFTFKEVVSKMKKEKGETFSEEIDKALENLDYSLMVQKCIEYYKEIKKFEEELNKEV